MSEITTREYRYVNRYVNLFFARPVDPARAHVTSVAARDRGQSSYESYHLRDTSSKVSVYLSREFAEKKFIWRTRPRPTGGGDTRFLNWEICLDVPRAAREPGATRVILHFSSLGLAHS